MPISRVLNAVFTSISQSDPLHLKNKLLENKLDCLTIFKETGLKKNGNLKWSLVFKINFKQFTGDMYQQTVTEDGPIK